VTDPITDRTAPGLHEALDALTPGDISDLGGLASQYPAVYKMHAIYHAAKDADRTIEAYEAVAEAARDYSPERDHDWRCEYRTAEVGWQPGDPPVIRCECGFDELQAALAALDIAKEAGR
jgi:hypothetical protein